jgi:hypothetical protein
MCATELDFMDNTSYGCCPYAGLIIIINELNKIIEQMKADKLAVFIIDTCLRLDLEIGCILSNDF